MPCDRDTYGELLVKKAMTMASMVLERLSQPGAAVTTDTSPA